MIESSSISNQLHLIRFSLAIFDITNGLYKHSYSSQRKSNLKKSRVKSPTKANTYLQNGDFMHVAIFYVNFFFKCGYQNILSDNNRQVKISHYDIHKQALKT